MRSPPDDYPLQYRLVNDERVVVRYAFWGVDRPEVVTKQLSMLQDCAARPLSFDFSTTYMSAPLYNGNVSALVYAEQADNLKKVFSRHWRREVIYAKKILDRHNGFFKETHDKHWVYRFEGLLANYEEGMPAFSNYLKDNGVRLARVCAEVCQVGTGYGLEIAGTLRAPIRTTDEDKIKDCMRQLQQGVVKSLMSIDFKVDSPMTLDPIGFRRTGIL